jgi:hypothetical protein
MKHRPSGRQLASFRAIFSAIYHVYPCPVCRGHFRQFFPDDVIQKELIRVTLDPKPSTINPKSSTLTSDSYTLNPRP